MKEQSTIKSLSLLTATEASGEIKKGNITATELVQASIDHIDKVDPKIMAWEYFNKNNMLEQAEKIDNKIKKGEAVGPLCGLPVGVKDIFNTLDMPTCMGSSIWKEFSPGNDARVVSYIRWADGIIAGKTVTAEFAVHHPGKTVNPHNPDHTPGTSSSGSAAAVASYMVPLAIGTQTAGSTIRPASYCGVYGMKPSFGLIPRTGILKTLDTLDHVTFLSRSVDDLELMLEVLRVRGKNFPFVHKIMDNRPVFEKADRKVWKVAFVSHPAWDCAEDYAKEAIEKYVSKISRHEQIIVEAINMPREFNSAHDLHNLIYTKALSYYFKEEYENHRDKISDEFSRLVENGRRITFEQYSNGLEQQNGFTHRLDTFFDNYDIVLTLSTSGEAPKGLSTIDKKDSCLIWTLCHVPAINLPVFEGPNGLPFGAQIISKRYNDYKLIEFAKFLHSQGLIEA